MSDDDVLYGYRLRLFALAAEIGVRAACRAMGVHHSTYYRWKARVDRWGLEALRPRERAPEQLRHSAEVEVDDHLMMLHALAALHRAQVPHDAIVTVAHASQSAISEHPARMHSPTIQSNLDRERLKNTAPISRL